MVPDANPVDLSKPPAITILGPGVHVAGQPGEFCGPGRWRLHSYATPLTIIADGRSYEVGPGWIGLFPPQAAIEARFTGRSVHTCAHFQLADGPTRVPIPVVQDLGSQVAVIEGLFQDVLRWFERTPHRAEARLWDLLWQLADQKALAPQDATHPVLARTKTYIHAHLGQDLSVERLAEIARCAPNRLLALFRRELGCTTVGYIRTCRVKRAEHLLRWSDIPIKEIAAEVGIPDLHFFNKTIRAALGSPPRAIRQAARG